MAALPAPSARQTLLFSATMTGDLTQLMGMAERSPHIFDATEGTSLTMAPEQLLQKYIFIPARVKSTYLVSSRCGAARQGGGRAGGGAGVPRAGAPTRSCPRARAHTHTPTRSQRPP